MTIEIKQGTIEERILQILFEVYPITPEDIADELGLTLPKVELGLKRLQLKGIISYDILPDKKYIRLQRTDIRFIGRKESQKIKIKHKGRGKGAKKKDYEGHMYG